MTGSRPKLPKESCYRFLIAVIVAMHDKNPLRIRMNRGRWGGGTRVLFPFDSFAEIIDSGIQEPFCLIKSVVERLYKFMIRLAIVENSRNKRDPAKFSKNKRIFAIETRCRTIFTFPSQVEIAEELWPTRTHPLYLVKILLQTVQG